MELMVSTADEADYSMSFYGVIPFLVATEKMVRVVKTPLVKKAYFKIE